MKKDGGKMENPTQYCYYSYFGSPMEKFVCISLCINCTFTKPYDSLVFNLRTNITYVLAVYNIQQIEWKNSSKALISRFCVGIFVRCPMRPLVCGCKFLFRISEARILFFSIKYCRKWVFSQVWMEVLEWPARFCSMALTERTSAWMSDEMLPAG